MALSQRHLLAARGFEIPLSINIIRHQDAASESVGDVAATAFYSTCIGAHYIRCVFVLNDVPFSAVVEGLSSKTLAWDISP